MNLIEALAEFKFHTPDARLSHILILYLAVNIQDYPFNGILKLLVECADCVNFSYPLKPFPSYVKVIDKGAVKMRIPDEDVITDKIE